MSTSTSKSKSGASSMAELMKANSNAFQTLKKGDIVEGTVKKLTPKEILLEIGAKGDALVIEYDKKNLENLLALLKVGDKVKASVISPESEDGFPVVSLRRMLDDMVYGRFENLTSGDKVSQVHISDSTRGGFFAETKDGIKGFLPNSQVLDEENLVGKTIDVKVIEFDREKKRVIFSQKATVYAVDPEEIAEVAKRDAVVKGTVTSVIPYGMYVSFPSKKGNPIEGFIHISEISYERIENLAELFKKGDVVEASVIEADRENRRVNLSIKKTKKDSFDSIKDSYKLEQKVTGTVIEVSTRGVKIEIAKDIAGFIPSSKISSQTYKVGDSINAEITDFDMKRRVIVVSPILKAVHGLVGPRIRSTVSNARAKSLLIKRRIWSALM